MEKQVLGKRAKTHDTDMSEMKKKKKEEKPIVGFVEIGISAYEKDEPFPSPRHDYLRPESPKMVDLIDLLPPFDWGWTKTEPPVWSHKEDEIIIPDSDEVCHWILDLKVEREADLEDF